MKYILDSSVFMQAKNEYYNFEFCPAFWELLVVLNQQDILVSIDRVLVEILKGNDKLVTWVQKEGKNLFKNTNIISVKNNMNDIYQWLKNNGKFSDAMIDDFYDGADIWLIASAMSWECSVVTQESIRKSKSKIQIPEVCDYFKVKCISTFKMLEECNRRFILEK